MAGGGTFRLPLRACKAHPAVDAPHRREHSANMTDEVRKHTHAVPFVPFLIKTSDGRQYRVKHPDYVAFSPKGRAIASKTKTVISTEAKVERRAERSGEPSLRDRPSGRHGGQTSNFSSRGRRRRETALRAPHHLRPKGKVRGFSTTLRPLARLRFGRNDRFDAIALVRRAAGSSSSPMRRRRPR